jgi:predicted TIM-barrel fold metal-dependent hydrolase
MSEFCTSNQQARDFIDKLDDPRIVPFFFLDPRRADAARQIEQAARDGFRGIKMYPPQGWFVDEPRVLDAFRAAEELDLPVFLHLGRTCAHPQLRSKYAMPDRLEGLGMACPRLKVILGHFASPWSIEACHLALSFRFYFDLSTSGSWYPPSIRFAARCPYLGVASGFGCTRPHPRQASSSARPIASRSSIR